MLQCLQWKMLSLQHHLLHNRRQKPWTLRLAIQGTSSQSHSIICRGPGHSRLQPDKLALHILTNTHGAQDAAGTRSQQ